MAIAPTGAIYKTLTFDGENSGSYGVYITGEAVYNAPERDVEMITIPGRNGAYALDKGRFQNIEVTYPAGMFADNEVNWAQAISDFRNMLCSKRGYVRLTDEYNPNEYRLAIYKSGLEVDPKQLRAGEFDITFECKPQRFLTSGEEKVTMGVWGQVETETGPIVTIEADDTTVIKDLTADIEPIQSGSGDPSPSNIRPISGHTDVVVTVADDYDNPTVSDTYTTALGTTVYGGTLDVTTGVLTVTHGYVDLGTLNWTKINTQESHWRFWAVYNDAKLNGELLSSQYEQITATAQYVGVQGVATQASGTNTLVMVSDERYSDATSFTTAMNGVQLVYELATPTTTTLTAQQIDLLLGQNNIWSDTGDVTLEYGQNPNVIINPTLFESSPLLEVDGYGDLNLNADTITIENAYIGNIPVASEYSWGPIVAPSYNAMTLRVIRTFDTSLLNVGDTITLNGPTVNLDSHESADTWTYITNFTYSNLKSASANITSAHTYAMRITFNDLSLAYGTPFTSSIGTMSFNIYNSYGSYGTPSSEFQIVYDGADSIKIYWDDGYRPTATVTIPQINANSTKSALLSPIYIDLDIGEAYGYESGSMVSLDNVVSMPAILPTLKPGANAISHDNTITSVEIIPRWWKV